MLTLNSPRHPAQVQDCFLVSFESQSIPVLILHIELVHGSKTHDPTADKHYVPDIHHAKHLDAFDAVLQRIHGAWTRHCGANQPLWCTQLPVLILHIELMHGSKTHDPTADKHYVPDIHHAEPLDAFDAVLQRIHGAWTRHCGANQSLWCTRRQALRARYTSCRAPRCN